MGPGAPIGPCGPVAPLKMKKKKVLKKSLFLNNMFMYINIYLRVKCIPLIPLLHFHPSGQEFQGVPESIKSRKKKNLSRENITYLKQNCNANRLSERETYAESLKMGR